MRKVSEILAEAAKLIDPDVPIDQSEWYCCDAINRVCDWTEEGHAERSKAKAWFTDRFKPEEVPKREGWFGDGNPQSPEERKLRREILSRAAEIARREEKE